MKKWIALCLAALMCFGLCACESKEEREARRWEEASRQLESQYQKAQDDYNDFQKSVDRYKSTRNALF